MNLDWQLILVGMLAGAALVYGLQALGAWLAQRDFARPPDRFDD